MTLEEIKSAVDAGRQVHWKNNSYRIIKDRFGQWLIIFNPNGYSFGLTRIDGVTMNGKPDEFFIGIEVQS